MSRSTRDDFPFTDGGLKLNRDELQFIQPQDFTSDSIKSGFTPSIYFIRDFIMSPPLDALAFKTTSQPYNLFPPTIVVPNVGKRTNRLTMYFPLSPKLNFHPKVLWFDGISRWARIEIEFGGLMAFHGDFTRSRGV